MLSHCQRHRQSFCRWRLIRFKESSSAALAERANKMILQQIALNKKLSPPIKFVEFAEQ